MPYIIQPGTDDVGYALPWFLKTNIVCPRCSCQFCLTFGDMIYQTGPHGATPNLWHGWRQVVEGTPATAQAIDTANLHVDPAQVYGPCPYCGYNPIVVKGPHYGTTKTTFTTDPAVGVIQGYIAGGATQVGWYRTTAGAVIGVFFKADSTPYGLDALGNANAVRRTGANTLDATTTYLLHTPATRIPVTQVQDAPLVALLTRLGLAMI